MERFIHGIQQVGIGVADAEVAFNWYKKIFGTDIVVFKDTAIAILMRQYTGNVAQKRHAILAMNMQGGGGFEMWQYADKNPLAPAFEISLGDTGVFATKIRCKNIDATYDFYKSEGVNILTGPALNPENKKHFYIKDPWNNIFEIIEDEYWFTYEKKLTGAVAGVVIGISDMEASINFYSNVLGFDFVVSDTASVYKDLEGLEGGNRKCRRVILRNNYRATGAFGKLLGPVHIELIQVYDYQPKKIYKDRHWGDLGFIHVCFDVGNMCEHEKICEAKNYPLTVNSANSFDMGEASGHFAYNEDPDGTLIEYVETHKVPIAKKMGLYLNLKKRDPEKCLPNWVVRCLRFSRVK
jgi:catechol 2,3-dioxygenase-like lactoylglutathione lyase family enzyme